MPITEITRLYHELLDVVPEHMAALNICLVKGRLRPATLVEPDLIRGVPVKPNEIIPVISKVGISYRLWTREPAQLLVYAPEIELRVQESSANQMNHTLFGKLLGYRCVGEFLVQGVPRYFVNFVVRNPSSRNDNPFMGYICTTLTPTLIDELRVQGHHYKVFFSDNEITTEVKLHIWYMQDGQQHSIVDEWL